MSMLQVWDAVIAQKSYYDRTGYLGGDRNFQESFLMATQVIPDRAKVGYLGPFSWEAIQGPPAYDEYGSGYTEEPLNPPAYDEYDSGSGSGSDSGYDSGYADEPLTPPAGALEVVSVVSSDAYSQSFVGEDEEVPFPVDREEDPEELDLEDPEELDLEYLAEAIGRKSGATARKRGYDEVDSDQGTYPRKRQC